MIRIAPDFSRFLRSPDGKAIPAKDSNFTEKLSETGKGHGNYSVVFVGMTLLIIAVLVFLYIINKNKRNDKVGRSEKREPGEGKQ